MDLSLAKISEIVEGNLLGDPDFLVKNIIIDSRKFFSPRNTLFAALRGQNNDGHDYIHDLLLAGLSAFIVEIEPQEEELQDASFIVVKNSLKALQDLASWFREEFRAPVVGITGSNGKTIVKEWIYQAMAAKMKVIRSPQSYNSQVGVPLSLFLLDERYNLALIEAGISRPGEMDKLRKMIRPQIGIMTNLGEAHQENFDSLHDKAIEKMRLFAEAEKIIYCGDYKIIHEVANHLFSEEKLVTWGSSNESDYYVVRELSLSGTDLIIKGKVSAIVNTPNVDLASIENCIHVIVFLFELGFEAEYIQKAISKLEPVSMRMEIIKGTNNCTLINDSYNSDLISLANALDYLDLQIQHEKSSLVISDILQTGKTNEELYQELARIIKNRKINRVIGIGENLFNHQHYFSGNNFFYVDTDSFLKDISRFNFYDESILLKGARKYEFERISSFLQESAHRTVLEIDLSALISNYLWYRSQLNPDVKIMGMVKAFSYGSGGYEIANILQYQNIDYLAVAYADEGVSLRKSSIRTPIMVMSPETNDFNLIVKYNLEPEIYSRRILKEFKSFLEKNAIKEYPVHIKLDTGMHRLGFEKAEAESIINELRDGVLRVVSVFSHLATSDDEKQDEFTRRQIEEFGSICSMLKKELGYSFMRHILNTSGIERFPEAQFEMVRLGIGLYGVSEFAGDKVMEVSTFKTRITQIKELEKGETIGYNRVGKVDKQMRIATIPVGYADGIPRSLSNGIGKFRINRHLAPLIGNVCMDMCMLDITGIRANEGDEVIIFGKDHSVKNIAKYSNTIAYEILTGISRRVKRVYYQE
jgi:alanine racemase